MLNPFMNRRTAPISGTSRFKLPVEGRSEGRDVKPVKGCSGCPRPSAQVVEPKVSLIRAKRRYGNLFGSISVVLGLKDPLLARNRSGIRTLLFTRAFVVPAG